MAPPYADTVAPQMAPPVLWHIELSHYNEKARWALDYKGIPHVRKTPTPGFHGLAALWVTRGAQRRLPVLVLDGRAIGDSTAIIEALEAYQPEPPLYPADAGDRARALELEDYFDEQLAPAVRSFGFYHALQDREVVGASLYPGDPNGRSARLMGRLTPVLKPAMRLDYNVSEADAERSLAQIRAAMDRLESEIQPSGYLAGDRFSVADLTAAALFTPALLPPERQYRPPSAAPAMQELRAELEARDGGRWVHEMFARHRGTSAEVAA
jgi:glutathione S-transferase